MENDLKKITYEELSEILQSYLDRGETVQALEYCEDVARTGNPYGHMFMGFIYEEGHGVIEADYKKTLHCYEKADAKGCDMQEDMRRVRRLLSRMMRCNSMYCDNSKNLKFF